MAAQIGLKNPSLSSGELDYPLQGDSDLDNTFEASLAEEQIPSFQQQADDGRLELASAFASGQGQSELADNQAAEDADVTVSGIDTGDNSQINQLADKLALANDEVNKAQQENIELRERLALLEAQVATMAALLEQAENSSTAEAAAPAKNSPLSTDSAPQNLGQQLAAVPAYIWLLIIAVILVLLVLLVRKSAREQESRALGNNQDLPLEIMNLIVATRNTMNLPPPLLPIRVICRLSTISSWIPTTTCLMKPMKIFLSRFPGMLRKRSMNRI